jgi:hypothetical protein
MRVIFLDIHGVLNDHDDLTIHKNKIALVNTILMETGAKIVLTSSWRYMVHKGDMTIDGLNYLFLTHGLKNMPLIDVTEADSPRSNLSRGQMILRWLQNCRENIESFVVLDDLDDSPQGLSPVGQYLVKTNSNVGLTKKQVEKAIDILKNPILPLPI